MFFHFDRAPIRSKQSIPVHKQMPIVVAEQLVVDMVITSSTNAYHAKERIPCVRVFAVNEAQVIAINGAESHVTPHVAMDYVGSNVQRNQNHKHGIVERAIKRIEQYRGFKHVMGLMASNIDGGDFVFYLVHDGLEKIDDKQLCNDMDGADTTVEGII